jgi:hypothetical protein
MSSLIFRLVLIFMLCLAFLPVLCLVSLMDLTIAHMVLVHERAAFLPRRFGYSPCPHRGDRFPRRPGFSARASHTHFESKHLDGPHFPRHGSHLTGPNDEVERTVKTSSGRMVKFWIPKIYLTNPSTKPSISSHPM